MTAEIVWRNPLPPTKDGSSIERLVANDHGAVYAVRTHDAKQRFVLILGGAACRWSSPSRTAAGANLRYEVH